jgi:chromate transporter
MATPGVQTLDTTDVKRPSPPLGPMAWVFARFGNTVYGGGSPTIAVLEREITDRRGWLDRGHTQLAYAVSRLTPGTNLLAFCTGAGWLMRRGPGALVALAAASIPCSMVAVALTLFYQAWANHAVARFALRGALASAVAIMVATCWTLVRPHWRHASRFRVALLFVAAFTLATVWGQSPIRVLALSAVVGALWPEREVR